MLIHSLKIKNLLSFGHDSEEIVLKPLNVIIGANGSGKSNLFEAISLLQAAPVDLSQPVCDAGGIEEWLWKPGGKGIIASVEAVIEDFQKRSIPLRHHLSFRESGARFDVVGERIETRDPFPGKSQPYIYYRFENGRAWLNVTDEHRELKRETVHPEQSILSQKKDSDTYPEITGLGEVYREIKLYREWSMGRYSAPRLYQNPSGRSPLLDEDFKNLGLVLNRLRKNSTAKAALLDHLRIFNEDIKDIDINIENGKIQIFLQENNVFIPATRLSDGTLRFISLLSILLDPNPPPLVCIDEIELSLHPDILPTLSKLVKDASQRMQLIVTTHSDIFVDGFSDTPEDVIVCDKENMQTRMRRLDKKELEAWLEDYSLGGIWIKGEIGGKRW
ncbi:MAG: chromosome segregation protein SMC [Magnetococcales bacterium]|nr:chromosome segregation protein SMC [Magnetococcales bacterium]